GLGWVANGFGGLEVGGGVVHHDERDDAHREEGKTLDAIDTGHGEGHADLLAHGALKQFRAFGRHVTNTLCVVAWIGGYELDGVAAGDPKKRRLEHHSAGLSLVQHLDFVL